MFCVQCSFVFAVVEVLWEVFSTTSVCRYACVKTVVLEYTSIFYFILVIIGLWVLIVENFNHLKSCLLYSQANSWFI